MGETTRRRLGSPCDTALSRAEFATALNSENGAMLNNRLAAAPDAHQTWICPVVRDSVEKDPEFARITVLERGGLEDRVKCTFEARDPKGLTPMSADFQTRNETVLSTNPAQVRVYYIYAEGEPDLLFDVPKHGYYYFKCTVPDFKFINDKPSALSGVINYIVTEPD
jgi:hypothetical protein